MKRHGTWLRTVLGAATVSSLALGLLYAEKPAPGWTQWGGPNRDFTAQASGLAEKWAEDGPAKLWTRDLGDGYSAILYDSGLLYTMYRDGEQEVVIAMEAKSGETVWEQRYDASPKQGHVTQFGEGPRATPLIAGNRIYTIGVAGKLFCLNKANGKVVWSHDLWGEFDGTFLNHGYSSSPIQYKNKVIALVGGEGHSIVAFNKANGKVVWKKHDFKNSYSSPRIMKIHGEDQLVTFMANELVGLDPENGELKWSVPHTNQWEQNINMPVMADANHMFMSSPTAGAKGLKLTKDGDKTKVEELWSTRKIQFYHVTSVRDGDWVYGSTGTMAPAFMAAVNIKTGEIAWRERGIAKANCVGADGKLIILDENGKLYLATATPEGLSIHSQAELLERVAWTAPTVVGKTLYVRDKKRVVALDLG